MLKEFGWRAAGMVALIAAAIAVWSIHAYPLGTPAVAGRTGQVPVQTHGSVSVLAGAS